MKKFLLKAGKKTLSVFLACLMLMTCWVFVAPEHNHAEAVSGTVYGVPAVNGSHYNSGTTSAYGTPVFDGTLGQWVKFINGSDYTYIYYPSAIYLDKSETLQSAGYYWNIQWYFGSTTDYRILLAGPCWGDYRDTSISSSSYPEYYTMTNIFSDYAVDASLPEGTDSNGGVYGRTSSSTNYDLRIVGYGYSDQGSDQFTVNSLKHTRYVLFRTRQSTNNATLYLKGTPSSSYVGTTTTYNTWGTSAASYGLAQKYSSSKWSTHTSGTTQFQTKWGGGASYTQSDGSTNWPEMKFTVTVYDKSALNTLINTAITMRDNSTAYSRVYRSKLASAITTAQATLTTRATTQTAIDSAKATLQAVVDAPEYRTYELTYENLFSLSDWWNSNSAAKTGVSVDLTAGKVTVQNTNASGEYVTTHSGNSATAGTRNTANYAMPVEGGKRYTIKYTTDHADTQMFAFFYNSEGGITHVNSYGAYNLTVKNGTNQATFQAPTDSAYMEIRFDNNTGATTANFWDIMIYDADRAAEIDLENWLTRPHRVLYTYNELLTASNIPSAERKGYAFNCWYLKGYTPDTGALSLFYNGYNFEQSWVVYSDWTQKTLDIGYDNLFSLSDWASSSTSTTCYNGTVEYDVEAGTITVTQTTKSPTYSYTSHSGNGLYVIKFDPVDTERTFVIKYDYTLNSGTASPYVLAFDTNSAYTGFDSNTEINNGYGTFTVPAGCDAIHIRFGVKGATVGANMTISNIAVYEQDTYEYAKNYSKVREPFKYGDTNNLMTPSRDGYIFDGWFTADGNQITSVAGLYESDTVYAHWTKTHTVTFLNGSGNPMHTATVITGNALTSDQYPTVNPTKASDELNSYTFTGWDYADGTAITSDITVKPVFTSRAHSNFDYKLYTPATCENNAIVTKWCGNCNYSFGNVVYDGSATDHPEFIAKGHDYDGEPTVVVGSATLVDGVSKHQVLCSRYTSESCGGYTYVDHKWSLINTTGATCTVKGTNHYKCACGATKTEQGLIAPTVHLNTTIINVKQENCTENGYTGDTQCSDCEEIIVYGESIPALGHTWKNTKTYPTEIVADCTTDAVYWQECETCGISAEHDTTGSTWTDTGSATGHKWLDEGEELYSPADCENDAVYYQTCEYCGISAKDDTTGSTWTKADTKWNHKFEGDYVTNNDGTHGRKCSNEGCSEIGDRTDCTYGAWDTNNADTHTKICTACSYKYTEKHSWSAWTSTDPSKTEDGQMTRSCEICGRTETTDCQYDVTADVKETCETDAYKTYTCADCGHGYTVIDKDSATGHNFDGEYRFNANTDFHNRKCTNDGCSKYGIGIKVDASGVNKWEACSWTYAKKEDGIHTATCVCGNSQDEECSGGEATCTTPATCDKCEEKYGETAPHNYSGTVVVLHNDNEDSHAYRCKFCDDPNLYGVGEEEGATEECNGGDATCSEKATCDVCGDEYGEVDSEDHILSSWSDNEDGTHTRTCTREGCAHGENGDAYSETENCVAGSQKEVVADCVSDGYMINVCAECGYEWDSDDVAPAGHKFGAWISDGEGSHTRTCIRPGCKYNETSDGPATETKQCTKDNATEVVTAPTCTEKGYTTYTCKDCGYSWVDEDSYTDPTGHTYEDKRKAVSATYLRTEQSCTEDLTYWYRCDNCNESAKTGATYTEETVENFYWVSKEASSHSFTKKTVTDDYRKSVATCTARAVYYYSCSACDISSEGTDGEKTFLYGSVLGHDWIETENADYLASPADCVNDATYYKHCSRCTDVSSKTWTKEESKTGHDFDHDDDEKVGNEGDAGYTAAVEATCTQAGVVAHYTCQVCGKYYEDADATTELTKITVKANGHVWQSVGYKEATCEEAGHTSHKECTVCEEKDSKFAEYEATGHNFTGDYVYHDNGYHSKLCVNDGCEASGLEKVKYSETTDEATDETVIAGAEKCEITGDYTHVAEDDKHYHSQSCVCGNTKKTECTEENDPVVTAPTCTEDGYTTHECSVCEEKWITDIVDALEHDLTDTATSNNDGATHSVKCKREGCDYKADAENCYGGTATCKEQATCEVCAQKYGTTGDHTLTEDGWESNGDATCTVNGTESQNCSVCEETIKRTEEDSALDHNMTGYGYDVSTWTYGSDEVKATVKAPTCAAEGKAISYCTRCDHYVTKTVAKLKDAHVWAADATTGEETWEYVSGDCSTYITYKCVCTQCGTVKTKTEQVEHDWTTVVTKVEATCKKEGYRTLKCGNCGAQKTEILQSAEHKWGDWSTYTEATCCEAEVEIRTCSACKTTEKRTGDVSATGIHNASNLVKWQAEPATCEADGFIEHYRSSCGKYFVSSDKGKTFTQVEWSQIKRGGTGHTDSNSDGKCDSCNTVLNSGTTTSDSCICHKTNWFMKTIYSVLKFFWKIFGINKTCDCGVTHY